MKILYVIDYSEKAIFRLIRDYAKYASLVVLTVALSNCGKSDSPTPGTFGHVYSIINASGCKNCHVPGGSATVDNHTAVDFTSQTTAYATLINTKVVGTSSVGNCSTVSLVLAGNATKSYLLGSLIPSYSSSTFAGTASCTPYSGHTANLSSTDQQSMVDWINNGALNN